MLPPVQASHVCPEDIPSTRGSEFTSSELNNLWRRPIEIAVPNPGRARAHIRDTGPTLTLGSVREGFEVQLLEARELGPAGFISKTFVLHRALVATGQAADDESDLGIPTKVLHLPSRFQRIEEELKTLRHNKSHDRRLRCGDPRHGCLHGERMVAHEVEQLGGGHWSIVTVQ